MIEILVDDYVESGEGYVYTDDYSECVTCGDSVNELCAKCGSCQVCGRKAAQCRDCGILQKCYLVFNRSELNGHSIDVTSNPGDYRDLLDIQVDYVSEPFLCYGDDCIRVSAQVAKMGLSYVAWSIGYEL